MNMQTSAKAFQIAHRGEHGGIYKRYAGEHLQFIEVIKSNDKKRTRKIKTKKDKRASLDSGIIIVFHHEKKSQDLHLTMREARQRIQHYETEGKCTDALSQGLREARRLQHS